MEHSNERVYTQADAYKSGWAFGFYAPHARSRSETRFDDILRHGARSEVDHEFVRGYRDGVMVAVRLHRAAVS